MCSKNCCISWASRNSTAPFLQMFFLTPNRNMFAENFVKWKMFLAMLREHIIFSVIEVEVEVHKMNKFFWAKLYCKMSDFIATFCWLWDLLLENLKLEKNSDHVHWNVQTNIKKLYARNNVSKKEFQIWDFESFIFFSKVDFWRTSLERFSQCFFSIFCHRPTIVADIFTQPPTIKKLSTTLCID